MFKKFFDKFKKPALRIIEKELVEVSRDIDQDEIFKMLIKHAKENTYAVVVGSQEAYDRVKKIEPYVNVYRLAEGFTLDFKEQSGGVLIHMSVPDVMIDWIHSHPDFVFMGGFRYTDKDDING